MALAAVERRPPRPAGVVEGRGLQLDARRHVHAFRGYEKFDKRYGLPVKRYMPGGEVLGRDHANPAVTLAIYSHRSTGRDRQAAHAVAGVLLGAGWTCGQCGAAYIGTRPDDGLCEAC